MWKEVIIIPITIIITTTIKVISRRWQQRAAARENPFSPFPETVHAVWETGFVVRGANRKKSLGLVAN